MRFNIVCDLVEGAKPENLQRYNEVVGYHLQRALKSCGHEAVIVNTYCGKPPRAENTVVTSAVALQRMRSVPGYLQALRAATDGRLCLWLDSDFNGWYTEMFDRILTVNRQSNRRPELYWWVGWAADPEVFRCEQKAPAVFVDTYMRGFYEGRFNGVYDLIQEAVVMSGLEVLQPIQQYNKGRVMWPELAACFRRVSYYVLTQPGFWGWTNIEAATCGALLLVHEDLVKPRSWPTCLNYRVYGSKEELLALLRSPVDLAENRRVAMENSWEKVASRVVEAVA